MQYKSNILNHISEITRFKSLCHSVTKITIFAAQKKKNEMKGIVAETAPESATRSLYIETYGCAMNLADSEVMASIMQAEGFKTTDDPLKADVVFLNTCAIRDNAEAKIWGRLKEMKGHLEACR
jgi:hypothetical protein